MKKTRLVAATCVLAAAAWALLCVAAGCGPSALGKAYQSYLTKVEPVSDRAQTKWIQFLKRFDEQQRDQTADIVRFREFLKTDAAPFFEDFARSVHAIEPGDPGLAAAHVELAKFADAAASAVMGVSQNVELLRAPELIDVGRKFEASGLATERYGQLLPQNVPPDPRFDTAMALVRSFHEEHEIPFVRGRATLSEVTDDIEKRVLPKIRELRGTKFDDDERSQRLREVIVADQEYFEAFAKSAPILVRVQRAFGATRDAAEDANKRLENFKQELEKVRKER